MIQRKPKIKTDYNGEKPPIFYSISEEIEYQSVVENVRVEDNNYYVEFNKAHTWDIIITPMLVALKHFHFCIDYEEIDNRSEIRYELIRK